MESHLPELQASYESVKYLSENIDKTFSTKFVLIEGVYCQAEVKNPEKVILFIGANIALEYDTADALDLLRKNKSDALAKIDHLKKELRKFL